MAPFKLRRGASLLEVIIATGIVALVMTSTVALMPVSLKTTSLSRNKSNGTKYTQEGIEYFRTQRNILGWETFLEILQSGGNSSTFCMATLPYGGVGGLQNLPNRPCQTQEYVDEEDRFKRAAEVIITTAGEQTNIHIEVSTTWFESGQPLSSNASLEFNDIYISSNFVLTYPSPQIPTPIPTPIPSPIPTPIPTPSPTPIPTPIPTPLPTPRGHWRFNENTGTTVAYASGNGNTGTWIGNGIKWIGAGINNVMGRFNGSGDGVVMAGSRASLNFGNNGLFTITGWVRPTLLADYAGFVGKDTVGRVAPYSYMTATMANGSLVGYLTNPAGWVVVCPPGSVSRGVWQHLAYAFNGTTMTGYVNGVACGSVAFQYIDTATHAVNIGSWYSPSALYDFIGAIDEVKLFANTLTLADVQTDYNLNKTAIEAPVASWRFTEGTGTTVGDATGTGHTGTWFGTNDHWSSQGISGAAGRFNYGDGVNIPVSNSFDYGNNGPFSVEGWIRPFILNDFAGFVSKTTNRATTFTFATVTMANGRIMMTNSSLGWVQVCPAGSVVAGNWQHLAITYDGATATGYVNGTSCGSVAWTYTDLNTANLSIGSWYAGINNYDYIGLIDEVNFYSYKRSPAQIAANATATLPTDTWAYRKAITITNTSGVTQTNYPVFMSVDTTALINAGKMNGDCSDLRFTAADGVTVLSHWLQEGQLSCSAAAKSIYVKVPSVPTTGTTIYAYYGSPGAAGGSNGFTTFEFFDDFNNSNLASKWAATGGYTLQNGLLNITTGSVYTVAPATTTTLNNMYEMFASWSATQTAYSGIMTSNTTSITGNNGNANRLSMLMSNGPTSITQMAFGADGSGVGYNVVSNIAQFTPTAGAFKVSGFAYTPTTLNYYLSRALTNSYSTNVTYSPYLFLGYFSGAISGVTNTTDISINFVIGRKFVIPVLGNSWAAEQAGSWTGL